MVTSANSHTPTQLGHESDALSASDGEILSQHRALGGRTGYRLHTPDPDQGQSATPAPPQRSLTQQT